MIKSFIQIDCDLNKYLNTITNTIIQTILSKDISTVMPIKLLKNCVDSRYTLQQAKMICDIIKLEIAVSFREPASYTNKNVFGKGGRFCFDSINYMELDKYKTELIAELKIINTGKNI